MHAHYGPHPLKNCGAMHCVAPSWQAKLACVRLCSRARILYGVSCLRCGPGRTGCCGLRSHLLEFRCRWFESCCRRNFGETGGKNYLDADRQFHYRIKEKTYSKDGIGILAGKGKLLPVVGEILDIAKKYEMVIATGHVSVEAAFTLLAKARQKGIGVLLLLIRWAWTRTNISLWKSSARSPSRRFHRALLFYGNARFQT